MGKDHCNFKVVKPSEFSWCFHFIMVESTILSNLPGLILELSELQECESCVIHDNDVTLHFLK